MTTYAAGSAAVIGVVLVGNWMLLRSTVDQAYAKDKVFVAMQPIRYPISGKVHREIPSPLENVDDRRAIDVIRERGRLIVGYDPEGLPFCHFNADGELVGFDIEMTQALAEELGVKVEYFPYEKSQMEKGLNGERRYDLLVGGLFATTRRVEQMRFSDPYLTLHLAVITPDFRKREFATLATPRTKRLRIGVLERPYFGTRIQQAIPDAEIVQLSSPREYFDGESNLDSLVMSAEAGSAWTLLYPEYTVVIPADCDLSVSVGYPMPSDGVALENVVSRWIDLKRKDGTIDTLYSHWIEGKTAEKGEPRWNVMTNVLGWGETEKSQSTASLRSEQNSR